MNRIQAMALLSATALAAMIAPTATSQERMRAGLWEMTTTKDGTTINMGSHCVTPEELASANGDAKAMRDDVEKKFAKASCTVKEFAVTGNAMTFTVDCGTGERAHTLISASEFHGDTVETKFTVKQATSTETMVTKSHRVGACT